MNDINPAIFIGTFEGRSYASVADKSLADTPISPEHVQWLKEEGDASTENVGKAMQALNTPGIGFFEVTEQGRIQPTEQIAVMRIVSRLASQSLASNLSHKNTVTTPSSQAEPKKSLLSRLRESLQKA